jgi:hypothetical protein
VPLRLFFFSSLPARPAVADRLHPAVARIPGKQQAFEVFLIAGKPSLKNKRVDAHPAHVFLRLFILRADFIKNDDGLKRTFLALGDDFPEICRRSGIAVQTGNVQGVRKKPAGCIAARGRNINNQGEFLNLLQFIGSRLCRAKFICVRIYINEAYLW